MVKFILGMQDYNYVYFQEEFWQNVQDFLMGKVNLPLA